MPEAAVFQGLSWNPVTDVQQLFAYPFMVNALAAGTIGQVHKATLDSGERVVVKVQRPTAEEDILQDLGLLEMFAKKAADRPAFRVAGLPPKYRRRSG